MGPRQVLQLLHEVRVVEKPHVENQIRIDRRAVLESERDEPDAHSRHFAGARTEARHDAATQIVNGQHGRVDDVRRSGAERRKPVAFEPHAIEHGERAPLGLGLRDGRQRVRAPGLAESPEQRLVGGVEKEQRDLTRRGGRERVEPGADVAQEAAHANVDAQRDEAHPSRVARRQRFGEHGGRQVVDAEKAEILQRAQRR